MIKDHLEQLQSRLEQENRLPEQTRSELLKLVAKAKQEAGVEAAEEEVEVSSDTDESEEPAFGGLMASVEGLEASHPDLAASINQVAMALSKMGI